MLLGLFDVGMCMEEFVFVTKHDGQGVMDPKQLIVSVERRRDSDGCGCNGEWISWKEIYDQEYGEIDRLGILRLPL